MPAKAAVATPNFLSHPARFTSAAPTPEAAFARPACSALSQGLKITPKTTEL